jgi:hypothetical protein
MTKEINKKNKWIIRIVRTQEVLEKCRLKSTAIYLLPKWKKDVKESVEVVRNGAD